MSFYEFYEGFQDSSSHGYAITKYPDRVRKQYALVKLSPGQSGPAIAYFKSAEGAEEFARWLVALVERQAVA